MTDSLREKGKENLWLSFGKAPSYFDQPQGIIIARTEGCYVFDTEGRKYLDAMGGQGAAALGYNYPRIMEAMRRQMEVQMGTVSGFPPSDIAINLAEKVAGLTPQGLNKIFYCHSGSEANDTAIKLAYQYHKLQGQAGRYKVISRWGGYHGASLATTAASGFPWRRQVFEPLPPGFIHVEPPYCYRCAYGKSGKGEDLCGVCDGSLLQTLIEREGPSTIAAIIMEQTIGSGGMLTPPPAYIQAVRRLCDEHGILMIVDEVATGFGKTGTWFEVEQYGIVPDVMTIGKAFSGGHAPLSAVCIHEKIAQSFIALGQVFDHGFTSAGNPLSCAAAIATIEEMQETGIVNEIPRKHEYMIGRLMEIAERSRVIGDVRGKGVMLAVEFVQDVATRAHFDDPVAVRNLIKQVQYECGVFLGGFGTSINMMLPLVISDGQMDQACQAVEQIARAIETRSAAR